MMSHSYRPMLDEWNEHGANVAVDAKIYEVVHPISRLLSEKYSHHSGNFLRVELVSYLPVDNLMAASSTCQAMRNSVHDMMKGSQIPAPSDFHILTTRALLEWGMSNGYQLEPDRDDDDRDIEIQKPDTWVRRIGSFNRACLAGNLEVLHYLIEVIGYPRNLDFGIMFAAYGGHVACLEYLCELPDAKSVTKKCLEAASYAGHVEVLDWLRLRFYGGRIFAKNEVNRVPYYAALGGHRSVIQWLSHSGYSLFESYFEGAAEGGHVELLQWLAAIKCPIPRNLTYHAGIGGSEAVLVWLRDAGFSWNEDTFTGAVAGGHVETLEWLIDNGYAMPASRSSRLLRCAVMRGHISMLMWLVDHGYRLDREGELCYLAASNGQLSTLQFLRSRGCPWASDTARVAVQRGRINTLRWAIQNGYPVSAEATLEAAKGGHLTILKLLVEEFLWDIEINQCIKVAKMSKTDKHKQVIAWLRGLA